MKLHGISKVYDFARRVQKVLAKKPGSNAPPVSAMFAMYGTRHHDHHHAHRHQNTTASSNDDHSFRINRLSVAGMFLRKFVVHFDRLVFREVAILHSQLERYLEGMSL